MATYTDQQMLEQVREAIFAALNHQSYSINGRSFTRQNLSELQKMEDYYAAKVARAAGKRAPAVARFREPT